MSVLPIVIVPDPILKMTTEPITEFDETLNTLIDDMIETSIKNIGAGLAGPQVGILSRLFVITLEDDTFPVINPEIIEGFGSETKPEACLSIPDYETDVTRFKKIAVRYQDHTGATIECEFKGFLARVFQHEFDHLNGILITDRAES